MYNESDFDKKKKKKKIGIINEAPTCGILKMRIDISQ